MKNFSSSLTISQRKALEQWSKITIASSLLLIVGAAVIITPVIFNSQKIYADYKQTKLGLLQDQNSITQEQELLKQVADLTEQAHKLQRKHQSSEKCYNLISAVLKSIPASLHASAISHHKGQCTITIQSNSGPGQLLSWLEQAKQHPLLKQLQLNSFETQGQKTTAHLQIISVKKETQAIKK